MKVDFEKGIANRIYRSIRAFCKSGLPSCGALDDSAIAGRYARGNVKLQMGLVMSGEEYLKQKERVLSYDFI